MGFQKRGPGFCFVILWLLFMPACISAQSGTQYQKRSDRWEGVKSAPVSGYDLELLSALIETHEAPVQMPSQVKVRFFLKSMERAFLTVREKEAVYFYWLDKVTPAIPWKPGFGNRYEWSTQSVLRTLGNLKIEDLGLIVRLEREEPTQTEKIAPVVFYHDKLPTTAQAYVFTFKPADAARLEWKILKEDENVTGGMVRRASGGKPLSIRWDASQSGAGWYKLVIKGYFLKSSGTLDKTVLFYHQPTLAGE